MGTNPFFSEICGNFGFGCMRLPLGGTLLGDPEFKKMIDAFLDAGFNYFDTAHGYLMGQSEKAIKRCLVQRYPRERFVLANKLSTNYFSKKEEILPLFERQLRACGVDYFDFYLMHAQDDAIYEKYQRCHAYETVYALKAQGKIKHFGISFHDRADVLERILTEHPEIEFVQIQLNYVDWEDEAVQSRLVYQTAERHGKPVIVMEPVKGGSLVKLPDAAQAVFDALDGGSNASYAIRFAASQPNVAVVLSGMSDFSQMQDNLRAMRSFRPLDETELAAVERVQEIFRTQNLIPCTACRYCTEGCPQGIKIPDLFACMNAKKQFHNWNQDYYYENIITQNSGKASDCIQCGQCESICPQHLPIMELLQTVAKEFE